MTPGARDWIRAALVLGAAGLSGCGGPSPRGATAKAAFAPGCHYEARLEGGDDLTLEVEARCMKRGVRGFRAIESLVLPHVRDVRDEKGQPLRKNGASFELDGREPVVRYRVDLGAIANAADDFDIAARVGRSIVAPVSTPAACDKRTRSCSSSSSRSFTSRRTPRSAGSRDATSSSRGATANIRPSRSSFSTAR
jgi:hypothetical protein